MPIGGSSHGPGVPSGGFQLLEHTADVGVVATGDTLADALAWAAKGMFSIIADLDTVEPRESLEVMVTSTDPDALVVDWLNELLYRYEAEGFLPKEVQVWVSEAGTSLRGLCLGEAVDPGRHLLRTIVKAATYHDLRVEHDGRWRVQVILDV